MKKLAVYLDGTFNTLNNNTNVWRLRSLTSQTPDQRVYYSQGVGTKRGEVARGGVAGYGVDDEIIDAYWPRGGAARGSIMHEPLTKADLKLALDNFTSRLTTRLCAIIGAGFAALAVLRWLH
jgi:hypothetical protein